MISITGATGHIGGEALRILRESGVPVRALVRSEASAARVDASEVAVADYTDPEALAAALHPGDQVFMVSMYMSHDERLGAHENFVAAAAAADVAHIAYLSFINAAADAEFAHGTSHYETEKLIEASGVPFTFLRTSLYQATVPLLYVNGLCAAPAGAGATSWVSRRDCGAAVAAVLRDGAAHTGMTYDLTGPESLTMDETSERINRLLGLDFRYRHEDDFERLGTRGLPDPVELKPARRSAFTSMALGEQALVTDDIETLTGLPATPLDRHVLNYREQFTDPRD
jgi:uncharacterized protein YbjT (DUF2867 family)